VAAGRVEAGPEARAWPGAVPEAWAGVASGSEARALLAPLALVARAGPAVRRPCGRSRFLQ
jgi:hypothetical protein